MLAAAVTLLAACEPTVAFLEPQPPGATPLSSIDPSLTGKFMDAEDPETCLEVLPDRVISKRTRELAIARADAEKDPGIWIKGNRVRIDSLDREFVFRTVNDSLRFTDEYADTLFCLEDGDMIREKDSAMFLNIHNADQSWEVLRLRAAGDSVVELSWIVPDRDIEGLQAVTPVREVDSEESGKKEYIARPSGEEFATFLANGGFSASRKYKRIN